MKKELLVLLMLVSSAMILSAEGQQDEDTQTYGRGQGMMRDDRSGGGRFSETDQDEWFEQREAEREEYLETLEVISVTGSLNLVNGELPYVESDGSRVSFMAPWRDLGDLELENGMEVTVEGYQMPMRNLQWDDSQITVMVTKAVINGEEIVVEHLMDGKGSRMGGFGGHGGSGSRGGRGGSQGGMMGRNS